MRIIISLISIHVVTTAFNTFCVYSNLKERGYSSSFMLNFIIGLFHPIRQFWSLIAHLFMPETVERAITAVEEKLKDE